MKNGPVNIEQVYLKYVNGIYRYFYLRTNSTEVSQDLTSTTFHKLLENLSSFDSKRGNITQYLYSIARNNLIDWYRRKEQKDVHNIDEELLPERNNLHDSSVVNSRNGKVLKICLEELDENEQLLVHLKYTNEMSYKEIAKQLDIPVNTVGVNLHRILIKIEKILIKKGLKQKLDL